MNNPEDKQLNQPTKNYFLQKMKCSVARTEFSFFAGKLDVLAYNKEEKCFYISEGKRSGNIASVGHAIGQLIAYMSMIQERGYEFLDQISKLEHLGLTDFANFLENKYIKVCFYVTLPTKEKDKLLPPAKLMLKNLGDFGESIGLFFANSNKCSLEIPAKPIMIQLRKAYNRKEFLNEVIVKFLQSKFAAGLTENKTTYPNLIQLKERIGNPYLHFEVVIRKLKKSDKFNTIEIAFHLEFAKAHLKNQSCTKRKTRLQGIMYGAKKELNLLGEDFKFQSQWGKQWSRLYINYITAGRELEQEDLEKVMGKLNLLVAILKPKFDKINWGRNKKIMHDDVS